MVENNNILRLGACSKVYVRPGGARAGDSDGVRGGSHAGGAISGVLCASIY